MFFRLSCCHLHRISLYDYFRIRGLAFSLLLKILLLVLQKSNIRLCIRCCYDRGLEYIYNYSWT
ncbi:hypothetical protein CW304_23670 [Bacillus sp. UFRGS-B20]|nr:hypothetical protein CW304_23670 [Bacillus sp. UFRGS-B20]